MCGTQPSRLMCLVVCAAGGAGCVQARAPACAHGTLHSTLYIPTWVSVYSGHFVSLPLLLSPNLIHADGVRLHTR